MKANQFIHNGRVFAQRPEDGNPCGSCFFDSPEPCELLDSDKLAEDIDRICGDGYLLPVNHMIPGVKDEG